MRNLLILLLIFVAPAFAQVNDSKPIEIEAESLSLEPGSLLAKFEGQVLLQQGNLQLSCDSLIATYDKSGAILTIEAVGHISVRQPDLQVTAARAKYEKSLGTLILEGRPKMMRGEDRIEGERVILWPESGRVQILHAKGSVRGPKLETALPKVKP